MQSTCAQCGSVITTSGQFCTNCGATLAPAQPYRQSWEAPPAQNSSQVPPWAQAQGAMYQPQQQQWAGMNNQSVGGSLGFGGPGDTQAKNLIKIAAIVIVGAILLFVLCVTLAIVIPVPGIQTFFVVVAVVLFLIPWIIYNRIRRMIRRTIGGFWRFF